jgi:hypothetical protein
LLGCLGCQLGATAAVAAAAAAAAAAVKTLEMLLLLLLGVVAKEVGVASERLAAAASQVEVLLQASDPLLQMGQL